MHVVFVHGAFAPHLGQSRGPPGAAATIGFPHAAQKRAPGGFGAAHAWQGVIGLTLERPA